MKANEAPEKIYLYPSRIKKGTVLNNWYRTIYNQDSIEYVRKDAFIEKVCEGIEHLLSGYIIRSFHFGDSYKRDTLIEDIKNYMKGE